MFKCLVNRRGVNVRPFPGSHQDPRMLGNSGCRDEEILTPAHGGQSVGVNIHMRNMKLQG